METKKKRTKSPNSGIRKGQKIKRTLEWEEFGKKVIEGNLPTIQAYIDGLPDEKKFEAFLKIVDYFKPRLARTESQNLDKNGDPTDPVREIRIKFIDND